jgi:hypothetical protein
VASKPSNPWQSCFEAWSFALDCQEVMMRRLSRLARGDAEAFGEAQRMFSEKATTATLAVFKAASAWPAGGDAAAMAAVTSTYRSAVSANKRRLRR